MFLYLIRSFELFWIVHYRCQFLTFLGVKSTIFRDSNGCFIMGTSRFHQIMLGFTSGSDSLMY